MAKEKEQNVKENYFTELNEVNVSGMIEKKNGLSYLSWANAWKELKKRHPDAFYTIYESQDGRPYFTDGRTCWVKTGVTCCGIEHIEYLPIMDFKNQSITIDRVTSMDMNKAIQRSLTKACARHGLGLYVYAGEDLPEDAKTAKSKGDAENDQELADAFAIIRPNIESAPSRQYLNDIIKQNPALNNYAPFREAINNRYKNVA